jgi:IS1 family transposase
MYIENGGIRAIGRLEGVPNPLIIKWIRQSAKFISELLKKNAENMKNAEDIEILEMDELYSYIKKKSYKIYIRTAVNRNGGGVIDFEVSEKLDFWSYYNIADRIKRRYRRIGYLCTDGHYSYGMIKIADKHIVSKAETCLVESWNAKIRRKLARFNRRTCHYSKALDMVVASLTLLFNEDLIPHIFS